MIGPDGIKMEEEKVKIMLDWLVFKSVKEIQKFLRLANYYRKFVKDFTKIVRLLHELIRKKQKWKWKIRQNKLVKVLKKRFTIELILVALDLDKKMRIEIDMFNYVIGGLLHTICHPHIFHSSSMDHTLFQSPINSRTRLCTSHQFYRVLNDIPYSVQQP